ncbi:MAG: response regulator, partial [Leptospira sp.]|nr:response regulator [Leptospira sp.]
LISFTFLHIISILILYLFWKDHKENLKGIGYWIFSFIVQVLGSTILGLGTSVHQILSIVTANTLLIFSNQLLLIGLETFFSKKSKIKLHVVLLLIFISIHTYFTFLKPDLTFRILNYSFFFGLIYIQCFWFLVFRLNRQEKKNTNFLWILFLIMAVVIFLRGAWNFYIGPQGVNVINHAIPIDGMFILIMESLILGVVFYLILIINRKLNFQLEFQADILKQKNEELKISIEKANQLADEANKANKVKSEFLANMSHEIRTPMNGVVGVNSLLLTTNLSKEQEQYSKTIQSSSELLLRLIDDILDFSKIEAGKLIFEKRTFNFQELIEESTYSFMVTAKQKSISLEFTIDPKIPTFPYGDPLRIRQIITNLIGNAIKFTEIGRVDLSCKLKESYDNYYVIYFEIKDTGVGIPESKKDYIFNKFMQSDSSITRKFGGTGLGLAISKELTEMMGGEIGLETTERVGSKFWFTIKLHKPESIEFSEKVLSIDEKLENLKRGIQNNKLSILLVEDNEMNQMIASKIFKKLGIEIELATNGKQSIEKLKDNHFDLIFMDIQMPIMDGFEATKWIRGNFDDNTKRDVPIIALTAHAMAGDKEKCLAIGMNDYITKPITIESIMNVLQKYIK